MAPALTLGRAGESDLAFIMATERLPGYENLVGRWDEAQHRAAMGNADLAYLIARLGGEPVGFALLRHYGGDNRKTLVQRLAVTRTDQGLGRSLTRAIINHVFSQTGAHRLWIGCYTSNERARRCYEAAGFRFEGVTRGSAYYFGQYRDEVMLAILRPDWEADQLPASI